MPGRDAFWGDSVVGEVSVKAWGFVLRDFDADKDTGALVMALVGLSKL